MEESRSRSLASPRHPFIMEQALMVQQLRAKRHKGALSSKAAGRVE